MAEAIALAKDLNDMHGLAVGLNYAAVLGYLERNPAEVERMATDLIELSTRQNFPLWLAHGAVYRGWTRSASGDIAAGLSWIHDGIEDFRASGSVLGLPFFLTLKAETLHRADRPPEALEAIQEAEALAERIHLGWCRAELHRLRALLLLAVGAAETQIEASLCAAITIARKQKAISLATRAEATYAEFHRRKQESTQGAGSANYFSDPPRLAAFVRDL